MDSINAAQQLLPEKSRRRASFSPMRAIRSLSIGSQISHSSIGPDGDLSGARVRRKTLVKSAPPGALHESLARKDSKSSTEGSVGRDSISTQPTTPSITSQTASLHGDTSTVIKSGPLQPEPSILKPKKEYLLLTPSTLFKFKNRGAAEQQFSAISLPEQGLSPLTSVESHASLKDHPSNAEISVPLEKVVSVFKGEGTRPSFSLEIWWKCSKAAHVFTSLELDFCLPDERDDWLRQIRQAIKARAKAVGEELAPPEIEAGFTPALKAGFMTDDSVEIYPVIPRRPYTAPASEPKKNWRELSSFYLAFSKYSLILAHFPACTKPSLVQFGLVNVSRVRMNVNDERFDLVFRLPLEQPRKLQLSSRYYRTVISKLFHADTYLKPAWPLWTRREVFNIDDGSRQTPLPNGEDYGGFRTTLEAFIEGYHCRQVEWVVKWKDVQHAPQFCLLKPRGQPHYTAHQLLAVFRALRFNEFFKGISFHDVDFSSLINIFDNTQRLERTIWISRTGKHSLTRSETDMVESSSILFQELVSILLGSESIKHIDLTNVLCQVPTVSSPQRDNLPSAPIGVSEITSPVILLWSSLQTRCNSIYLTGDSFGENDASEFCRVFRSRPSFLRALKISHCNLDETSLVYLWEGLHEQRFALEELDTSYNPGRIEASRIARTLNEASGLRHLNLAHTIRGDLEGPLFRPWSNSGMFETWRLEDLDLSGWKINFETLCSIMKYLELEESSGLRRLSLNNCGLTGELATGIFCRIGAGRDMHLLLNENPLEAGSTDWIDLIHGNEAPTKLHLDMIQFQHEPNFNRLLTALSHNKTIEFLSMVGTGPPNQASVKTCDLLSNLFKTNDTLKFLDLSGYSGKLEDSHLGWGLSGALGGLENNTSLRQLRLRNHDMGAAEDLTELCRIITTNKGLAMFDIRQNSFDPHQFGKLVQALSYNEQLISFPICDADREDAINEEKRLFLKSQHGRHNIRARERLSKSTERRLDGVLTRLHGHWNSETEKAKDILERNRTNPANQVLELESEYLEAWDDGDLPRWLAPKLHHYNQGKRRASEPSIITLPGDTSPISPTFDAIPMTGLQRPFPRRASCPLRNTYVIEEET
ncbi:putative leucine rich repeat protein [Rosellinia necatrix]|uniref:Putative leucine rich repeat protein n=1 Tax=Rosellinia necatrix TaxID=77044 RepID=A0A1W2TEH9_ROSNE|nr:putative leucine rich repeat protein [Rosellinia necatrix]